MTTSFLITPTGMVGGPHVFGGHLERQLCARGWVRDERHPHFNICSAVGDYIHGAVNVLRLDNLYFDTACTLGNNDVLNAPIRAAYKAFDKIIFQSEFSMNMFIKHFGGPKKPYTIIHNGTHLPTQCMPLKFPFDKTFICVSLWRPHKRLDAIVAGLRKFETLHSENVGLIVVGDFNDRIDGNTIFVNGTNRDVRPYLMSADAFVHLAWLDACPNVVVEALCCGLPVLCSHNGGTKELVRDDGIILRLEDDYDFSCVNLYSPPTPDTDKVAEGMFNILKWDRPVVRSDLSIESVADSYIKFMTEV